MVFFEPSSPHNSQRIDGNQQHNEDDTYYHIETQSQTQQQTQTNTDTSPISSTTSFRVARGLHSFLIRTSSGQAGNEPKYRHSDSLASQSRLCTERPTGRVIIVIVAERGENDKSGKREEEREKRRDPPPQPPPTPPPFPVLSVCMLKTSPCAGSKRIRVCQQNARMCSTCAAFCQYIHTTTHNTQNAHPTHTHSQHIHHTHSQHTRTTIATHTHNTRQTYTYTYTYTHTTLTPHISTQHQHNRQTTVILRRKSECLDVCTAVGP